MNSVTRIALGVFPVFALSSCWTMVDFAKSMTDVQSVGPDTYIATSPILSEALKRANETCATLGKEILVNNVGGERVIFRCLKGDDPELKRPVYEASPTAVIKDAR